MPFPPSERKALLGVKATLNKSPRTGAPGFGMGCEAQSAAIPGGIASICNEADRPKPGCDSRVGLVQRRLKGVGPTVVARLEQLGIESLAHLGRADTLDIVARASALLGSTCWKNSPQARAAIDAAIALARSRVA